VIYTHPEAAAVGLTAGQAREQGYDVVEGKLPMSFSGRYLTETERGRGICKVVLDKRYHTLLGVHIIGAECSEMIYGASAMIEEELRVEEIREIVFPHPTVSEILKDTVATIQL
jgi:dihydrolipoamide dehydrogenase